MAPDEGTLHVRTDREHESGVKWWGSAQRPQGSTGSPGRLLGIVSVARNMPHPIAESRPLNDRMPWDVSRPPVLLYCFLLSVRVFSSIGRRLRPLMYISKRLRNEDHRPAAFAMCKN